MKHDLHLCLFHVIPQLNQNTDGETDTICYLSPKLPPFFSWIFRLCLFIRFLFYYLQMLSLLWLTISPAVYLLSLCLHSLFLSMKFVKVYFVFAPLMASSLTPLTSLKLLLEGSPKLPKSCIFLLVIFLDRSRFKLGYSLSDGKTICPVIEEPTVLSTTV